MHLIKHGKKDKKGKIILVTFTNLNTINKKHRLKPKHNKYVPKTDVGFSHQMLQEPSAIVLQYCTQSSISLKVKHITDIVCTLQELVPVTG